MSQPVLPPELRQEILHRLAEGASSIEVFDAVWEQASTHVDSENQLIRCIAGLKSVLAKKTESKADLFVPEDRETETGYLPQLKSFDRVKHAHIIDAMDETIPGYEFEKACSPIVVDILKNREGFDEVIAANAGGNFHNPPFDFLAFKNTDPYLVEFKGSRDHLNCPGETQKKRLQELLKRIEGLNVALLQVRLKQGDYRILYNDELRPLFDGNPAPLEPVENWIRDQINGLQTKPPKSCPHLSRLCARISTK